jgi:hypothetical protein
MNFIIQVDEIRRMKQDASISAEAFLYRSSKNSAEDAPASVASIENWWSFFEGVPEDEVRVFIAVSSLRV